MNLVLIIYIANMVYSYICLRETELSFNYLHSQHDLQLHMFERLNLILIIYIANMISSYICLRETELSFNHLHSQHDLQLHMFEGE